MFLLCFLNFLEPLAAFLADPANSALSKWLSEADSDDDDDDNNDDTASERPPKRQWTGGYTVWVCGMHSLKVCFDY
jgi:hypothetical protein